MNQTKGKFIVIYGINNLGKTTQAQMLVTRMKSHGYKAEYIKYPIYDLKPSGTMINDYLRNGNKYDLTPREVQILYAFNRTQYQKELKKKLDEGINIIAEDYIGTGLAWGLGNGVDGEFLRTINSHLLKEDMAFLFDGERFKESTEKNHKHETNDSLMTAVRWAHLKLKEEYSWIKINANLTIEEIHGKLWKIVSKELGTDNLLENMVNYSTDKLQKKYGEEKKHGVLKIERIHPKAKLPTKSYEHDAGFDFYSTDYYSLMPGQKVVVSTGLKIAIPHGYVGLFWDKSSIALFGIHTLAGVIDSGYRGEVKIVLINLGEDVYNIAPGQKVSQLLIQKIESSKIEEGRVDDETHRDIKSFGSSGLR